MSDIDFRERVAIITGAGRGLGRAYAHELACRGAIVVVHDSGADVRGACTTDASTESGGRAAVQTALDAFGRVDVVVANAGTIYSDPYQDWPTEQFEATLRHHVHRRFTSQGLRSRR